MTTVYRHRRLDTNEIFYIGIGKTEKRPYSKAGRNKHWKNIVNKAGYSVEIISKVDTWEEACELEQFLIQEYGRKDLGTGILVNMTDGGEGIVNQVFSKKHKTKLSKARTGKKLSEELKQKISESRKGYKTSDETKLKMSEAQTGRFVSEETRQKMSEARGGHKHPRAKKVINTKTGVIYNTIKEAAEKEGLNRTTLTRYLNGRLKNKTTLKFI